MVVITIHWLALTVLTIIIIGLIGGLIYDNRDLRKNRRRNRELNIIRLTDTQNLLAEKTKELQSADETIQLMADGMKYNHERIKHLEQQLDWAYKQGGIYHRVEELGVPEHPWPKHGEPRDTE